MVAIQQINARLCVCIASSCLLFSGCDKASPAVIQPPEATPEVKIPNPPAPDGEDDDLTPATPHPAVELPDVSIATPEFRVLSDEGLALIIEFEGYVTTPEAPDARYSGISWAVGYDAHQNKSSVIRDDWKELVPPVPYRLSATQPYYGRSAQQHVHEVSDVHVPVNIGMDVFNRIDASRVYDQCKRAFPGFDELKQPAKDALISLVFNRGPGMTGESRREMRELAGFIKNKDYRGMADCFRRMIRVWKGTEIYNGMYRRRMAEARMVES